MSKLLAVLAAAMISLAGSGHAGCGTHAEACEVDMGTYHARVPDGPVKGAILYLHGYGGTGNGALQPKDWVNTALARGYVLIAPDGLPYAEGRGRGWSFIPGRPKLRTNLHF